jgi:hypothetical protein
MSGAVRLNQRPVNVEEDQTHSVVPLKKADRDSDRETRQRQGQGQQRPLEIGQLGN